ncbi:uncharacterized protein BDW47DRAFT_39650 [Aspergillus candidus]|uniref:Uncharacterized protein n=1 Tax=Aspergillus candidus TaxID=41067 RepID=A0A2I2F907_ASPCN|nr:hypothetical protein BDW47DRAFT_39650 [Aspergillus candidus]PLB37088.1 hypothetical protein BDW47DRAFT_39650 [Aspergillus candidus]
MLCSGLSGCFTGVPTTRISSSHQVFIIFFFFFTFDSIRFNFFFFFFISQNFLNPYPI